MKMTVKQNQFHWEHTPCSVCIEIDILCQFFCEFVFLAPHSDSVGYLLLFSAGLTTF